MSKRINQLQIRQHLYFIQSKVMLLLSLSHDRGPYHVETRSLISRTNQWTGFYMISISVMKELNGKARTEKNYSK